MVQQVSLLLMNDEVLLRDCFRIYFSQLGYNVTARSNSVAAVDSHCDATIDVALVEICSLTGQGMQNVEQLCRLPSRPGVVILSKPEDEETVAKARQLGADEFVTRSCSLAQLQTAVEFALAVSRNASPSERIGVGR